MLKVLDIDNGQELFTFNAHTYRIRGIAFSSDGRRIVSGARDNTVKIWDLASREVVHTLEAGSWVNEVAFSPDDERVIAACQRGAVKVWDAGSGQEALTLQGHTQSVDSLAFSTDGRLIVSGSRDGTIKIWDAGTNDFIRVGH